MGFFVYLIYRKEEIAHIIDLTITLSILDISVLVKSLKRTVSVCLRRMTNLPLPAKSKEKTVGSNIP
jgi:hypothetical protein